MTEGNATFAKGKELYPARKIEQLWLLYYNETLYSKGLITESERNRMRSGIHSRQTSGRKQK